MVFSESSGVLIARHPTTTSPSPAAKMMRTCSLCGSNGHNSRTCAESTGATAAGAGTAGRGFMLFGVRLTENSSAAGGSSSFRKSASMTNLAHHDHQHQDANADLAAGYTSDDAGRCRERRRGVPWTEDEHRLFLLGLKTVGKGDWRGISRNFVKTRTPTQVASHAQKYFLRRTSVNRRRRRSSLFDITLMNPSSSEEQLDHESLSRSKPPLNQRAKAPPSLQMTLPSSKMADLNLNESPPTTIGAAADAFPVSLSLSAAPESEGQSTATRRPSSSAFPAAGFCGNGDSVISVA